MQILIEASTPIDEAVARIGLPAGRIQLIPLGSAAVYRAERIASELTARGLSPTVLRPLPADADLSGAAQALVRIPGGRA